MTDSNLEIRNSGIEKIILSCAYGGADRLSVYPSNKDAIPAAVCFLQEPRIGTATTVYASAADTRALGQALIELADQIETNKD